MKRLSSARPLSRRYPLWRLGTVTQRRRLLVLVLSDLLVLLISYFPAAVLSFIQWIFCHLRQPHDGFAEALYLPTMGGRKRMGARVSLMPTVYVAIPVIGTDKKDSGFFLTMGAGVAAGA
jgi:hypothetical protein